MDYKVFYRKYRPFNFETIVGQDYTKKMLQNAIINNKISHAYLFTGPRGTGKTSTAKVFAKTINCENIQNGEACGKCNSCINFLHSSDIIEIDAASNNGVDDVRELINNVKIAPSESKYKIYIIDEVHMLTQSAFNALLLTLEEPPAHAIFIMATTNVESVPITILSRCQRFNFKKISVDDIVSQVKSICEKEDISITLDALNEIAYLSEGGLRDALSLLDQLSSNGEEITVEKIVSNYGSISSLFIKTLILNMEKSDATAIIDQMNELQYSSSDYKIFIKKVIAELISKSVLCKKNQSSTRFSYEQLKSLIFDLNDCMNKVSIHINPYLLIQTILLDYVSPSLDSVSDKVSTKEQNVSNTVVNSNGLEKEQHVEIHEDDNSQISNHEMDVNAEEMNEYLEELKNIRVNNCFALAKKDVLVNYQTILNNLVGSNLLSNDVNSLLMDVKLVAAGDNIGILSSSLESTVNLINHHLDEIEDELEKSFNKRVSLIAVSLNEWNEFKKEYIQNVKNGVKYEVIDESGLNELRPQGGSQLESFASQMFGNEKIEVI